MPPAPPIPPVPLPPVPPPFSQVPPVPPVAIPQSGPPSSSSVSLGASTDYDFGAVSSVPIGLMLQFSWTAPVSGSGVQHVTDLGGGIFYTGREHLAVGLQLIARRFAVEQNLDVSWKTYITTIGLRYYW